MAQSKISYLIKSLAYILGRFVFAKKYLTASAPDYGLKLKFRAADGGGRAIYKKGFYEADLSTYFLRRLSFEKGDIVFDVGANIGWYSTLFARHFPGVEIHSFEPDPENYEVFLSNLERNNAKSVVPNKLGVGEKTETKQLHLYKKSNIGRHSMLDIHDGPTINVETVSFDDYIAGRKLDYAKIKFLKIDIEGFEYYAFLGGKELLKHVPIIMAEFSPGYMREGGIEPGDLLKLLRSYGLEPHRIDGLELVPMDDEVLLNRSNNINLLWKRH